jgi:hypothetical protein
MKTYAFVVDLERNGLLSGGTILRLADGLSREAGLSKLGPAATGSSSIKKDPPPVRPPPFPE